MPKWRTVYEFYRKWISTGFFDRLIRELNALARDKQWKSRQPKVAVIDSQSIRTGLSHSVRGVDGGKKKCNRIAPSLPEHICITLDSPSVNKYWETGS